MRTEDTISEQDYLGFGQNKFKIALISCVIFTLTFVFYFPVQTIYSKFLVKSFRVAPGCTISVDNYSFKFFLPHIEVKNLSIPKSCMKKPGSPIVLEKSEIYFGGFSFSPIGLVIKINTQLKKHPLNLYVSVGTSAQVLKLHDHEFDLVKLQPIIKEFINLNIKAQGKIIVNGNFLLENNRLKTLELKANSKTLKLLDQNIQGFMLPTINLEHLDLEVIGDNDNIQINKMIIGKKDKDLFASVEGKVKLNQSIPALSILDLKTNLNFSKKLLNQYSFISMLMAQFKNGPTSFKMSVKGSLGSPSVTKN
jgi:type II secretion system protein N